SQRMGVMYMGRMVEIGDAETLFSAPAHPYTRALADAAPDLSAAQRARSPVVLTGEIGLKPESGCPLQHRCPYAEAACANESGALQRVRDAETHLSACMRAWKGGASHA
ncbi:MAG: peptide ABC transporter ATP-binding protein, partial [Clostridia bacterium]|nr:peptide ABC transporter ATP-binding protein [Clostridia bacterium]